MEQLVIWALRLLIAHLALTIGVSTLGLIACVATVACIVWEYKNEWN